MKPDNTTLQDHIVADPRILAGKPTIKGTRISVALVLEYLSNNPNFDEFFTDYPELTMADVQAVLAYARAAVGRQRAASAVRQPRRNRAVRHAI